eukprot:SAG31_NODE_1315_length_8849_cov_809.105943_2_plen_90_part_00
MIGAAKSEHSAVVDRLTGELQAHRIDAQCRAETSAAEHSHQMQALQNRHTSAIATLAEEHRRVLVCQSAVYDEAKSGTEAEHAKQLQVY